MNCCNIHKKSKKCKRKDNKTFSLPRKFSKKSCLTKKIRGFTMRSSCAPYKYCKRKTKKKKGGIGVRNFIFFAILFVLSTATELTTLMPKAVLQVACTGNTCRSATMNVIAADRGLGLKTCGTKVRTPGGQVTLAAHKELREIIETNLGLDMLDKHRSQRCDIVKPDGCQAFIDLTEKLKEEGGVPVIGVMGPENVDELLDAHTQCAEIHNEFPPVNVIQLGNIVDECNPLKSDPYDWTKDGLKEQGKEGEYSKNDERKAYVTMIQDAGKCLTALEKKLNEVEGRFMTPENQLFINSRAKSQKRRRRKKRS